MWIDSLIDQALFVFEWKKETNFFFQYIHKPINPTQFQVKKKDNPCMAQVIHVGFLLWYQRTCGHRWCAQGSIYILPSCYTGVDRFVADWFTIYRHINCAATGKPKIFKCGWLDDRSHCSLVCGYANGNSIQIIAAADRRTISDENDYLSCLHIRRRKRDVNTVRPQVIIGGNGNRARRKIGLCGHADIPCQCIG